ncbi:MAG: hypothetical protein WAO98_08865 [Alphaproteobacteria bacterium]
MSDKNNQTNVIKFVPKSRKNLKSNNVGLTNKAAIENRIPMQFDATQPLWDAQSKSLDALVTWVANEQKVSEQLVRLLFEEEFGTCYFFQLLQADYDRAIQFLINIKAKKVMH